MMQEAEETLFIKLYLECFPAVARYVARAGGRLDQARDVFQEALLIYYENTLTNHLGIKTTPKAYILGIARNVYRKACEQKINEEPLDHLEVIESKQRDPVSEKILLFLQETGQRCMDILSSFYFEKLSMKNLSERFGFRSERSATVQKYKCLEKIRESIKEKSLTYEDFID